jgi:carbamoylphosphate synthase large subunit
VSTILVTGARAPVALHLARLLHGAGHRVLLADSQPRPLASYSALHDGFHPLPSPRSQPGAFAAEVRRLVRAEAVELVIPTCEEVFHLAKVWQADPPEAPLFAPALPLLAEAHDKHRFIRLCEGLGLDVPETRLLTSPSDLTAVAGQAGELVFKPVWSRFASHVLIRPSGQKMERIVPTEAAPWVAQEALNGKEISAYAVAQDGKVLALSLYRALYRAGKGASVAFAPVQDAKAAEFVRRFVAGTGWSGQASFDLMRMPDGRVLPLECNPRATSGLHFFRDPKGFAGVLDGAEVIPDVAAPQGVRLALWLYGLPAALRAGQLGIYADALREVQDVLDWPGDPGPGRAQGRVLAGMVWQAVRQGISLQQLSTHDIEWNGPADDSGQSSI